MTTGMPLPLLRTDMVFALASTVTSSLSMSGSRCLLSAAFTTISSNILYSPGVYVTSRWRMRLSDASYTNIGCVTDSVEPM